MPSPHLIPRKTCSARNAYNVSAALWSAFLQPPKRCFSRTAVRSKPGQDETITETQQRPHNTTIERDSETTRPEPPVRKVAASEFDERPLTRLDPAGLHARPGFLGSRNINEYTLHPNRTDKTRDMWKAEQQKLAKQAHELSKLPIAKGDAAKIEQRRQRMEYISLYIDAPDSPMEDDNPLPVPWKLAPWELAGKSGMDILDIEIERFARYVDLTPVEKAARKAVFTKVADHFDRLSGRQEVKIETYGSGEVGLATVLSDIDIRLSFHTNIGANEPRKLMRRMKTFHYHLMNDPDYMLVSFRHAHYPIINAQHKPTGMDIQIVSAPDATAQQNLMSHYLSTVPHLRPVYLVLKTALGIRSLVDVFNGGLGSYGLFMMLVAALTRPSSQPPRTASEALLRFLDFYTSLNTTRHAVSVAPPKLFAKHDVFTTDTEAHIAAARRRDDPVRAAQWAIGQSRIYQPYLLCLQDPANPYNDLGRKSNAIKHVQTTLRVLRNTLLRDLRAREGTGEQAPEVWRDGSILLPTVGRCHEIWFERRRRAGKFARREGELRDLEKVAEEEAAMEGDAMEKERFIEGT